MIDLGDDDVSAFLHSGCALIVGTLGADGQPCASRGWGLTIVDVDAGLIRVLVEADDATTIANIHAGGPIAVTATDVTSYRSMQLKGTPVRLETATAEDLAKRDEYTTDFTQKIHETDGYPLASLQHAFARDHVVPCIIEVDSTFDQTPGPRAGMAIGAR
jgi:hypothetical protein